MQTSASHEPGRPGRTSGGPERRLPEADFAVDHAGTLTADRPGVRPGCGARCGYAVGVRRAGGRAGAGAALAVRARLRSGAARPPPGRRPPEPGAADRAGPAADL